MVVVTQQLPGLLQRSGEVSTIFAFITITVEYQENPLSSIAQEGDDTDLSKTAEVIKYRYSWLMCVLFR